MYDNYLMQVISYVSTFVSIALAGIAIYISIKEATNNDKMKNEIFVTLSEMRSRIGDINTKMDSFNTNELQQINSEEVNEMKEKLLEDLKIAMDEIKGENVNLDELINEKVNKNTKNLIENLNQVQKEYINESMAGSKEVKNSTFEALNKIKIGEEFSIDDYMNRYRLNENKFISEETINKRLKLLYRMGYLVDNGDGIFKRVR